MAEYFDLRNEDGSITGKIKERADVHADGDLHATAHIWLVRKMDEVSVCEPVPYEVLLQKRSCEKNSWPGYYDISSAGHVPAGEDILTSAMRELGEELGVHVKPEELQFVGVRRSYSEAVFCGSLFKDREYSQVYAFFPDAMRMKFCLQKEEVESVCWMSYRKCLEKLQDPAWPCCIKQKEFDMLGEFLKKK